MKKSELYYEKYKGDANKYTADVLKAISKSDKSKVVIVSGPGTGKSYLFGKICSLKGRSNNLTLSFINDLIDDLKKDIGDVSEVRTLHSFALGQIQRNGKYYLDLEGVINKDYKIVFGKKIDFRKVLCNLLENPEALGFYFDRRAYYDHFSPDSSVYVLLKRYKKKKIETPVYTQILVDEYQDFNKLEASLIEILAEKNAIIIVGDDDQSLYGWKDASPVYIRVKNESNDYEQKRLPYCFRCPRVVIETYTDIVKFAKKNKLFHDKRVEKNFKYYPRKEMDEISDRHDVIEVVKNVFKPSNVAEFVDRKIQNCADFKGEDKPSVLIILPNKLKSHIPIVEKYLRNRGYKHIDSPMVNEREKMIKSVGMLIEKRNSKCNLSWRLVVEHVLGENKLKRAVKKNYKDGMQKCFSNYLDIEDKKVIKNMRSGLIKIKNNGKITKEEQDSIFEKLKYIPVDIALEKIKMDYSKVALRRNNPYKDIPIKITTILGSKGLSKDFVFLANFDDKNIFNKDKISNENICGLLVALTRAKRKVFILVSKNSVPSYIKWVHPDRINVEKYIDINQK